jgi:hypothetical protein
MGIATRKCGGRGGASGKERYAEGMHGTEEATLSA